VGEAWYLWERPGPCGRGLVPVGEAWSLWERPGPWERTLLIAAAGFLYAGDAFFCHELML